MEMPVIPSIACGQAGSDADDGKESCADDGWFEFGVPKLCYQGIYSRTFVVLNLPEFSMLSTILP